MPDDRPQQRRARSLPGEPMDVANMRSLGVRSLAVSCSNCRHEAVLNVDAYGADESPNWKEQPGREA
jgi:hypothetical protein